MKHNSVILHLTMLLLIFFALAFPVMAQDEPIVDEPPVEETPVVEPTVIVVEETPVVESPVVVVEETANTTAIVIGAFVTIGIMALGVLWTSVQSGKTLVESVKTTAESGTRSVISSEPIAAWGEERLSHIPKPLREAIMSINDAFSPFTSRTTSDLDNKTQEWVRNMLDGNAETGAVGFDPDDNPF